MTTIAYRDGVLAADTLMTCRNNRDGYVSKIRKRGTCLAACCGNWTIALRFLDWFSAGLPADKAPVMAESDDDRATGYVFMPDGSVCEYGRLGWAKNRNRFYSDGSGNEFATGAMAMGASAEEAVRVAMLFDTASGGEVQVLRH